MTERERLLFLINDMPEVQKNTEMADYLLSKGVRLPLVQAGDIIYALWGTITEEKYIIYCAEVLEVTYAKSNVTKIKAESILFRGRTKTYNMTDYNTLFFSTLEEAQNALNTLVGKQESNCNE